MFTTIVGFKPGPGLFRFILAFMVLIFHTISFFPLGHYAVYVFFMLSGYWIFKMFEEKAYEMGFTHAAVGAMVRSSYHADVQAHEAGV